MSSPRSRRTPPERRPRREPPPPGLLVVDKPAGWTSHDVVGKARGLVGTRRVGHAGTLDPMATGVLVLGVERATKLLGHLALDTKSYVATIRLGAATVTDDAEGETLGGADASGVDTAALTAGVAALTGHLQQVPSAVSAVKVDGRRAYDRVRAGESVELAARPVEVSRFVVVAVRRPADGIGTDGTGTDGTGTGGTTGGAAPPPGFVDLDVEVDCSTGTYVRALARDLGSGLRGPADVPVGGHLTALRRTRVGPFTLDAARTVDQLVATAEGPAGRVLPDLDLDAATALAFPRRDVDPAGAADLAHGRPLAPSGVGGTVAVFDPAGHVVGLVADADGRARPRLVLAPA